MPVERENYEFSTDELSEEAQEIIGRVPANLTMAGTLILFFICLVGIIAPFFIEFPEKIDCKMTFRTGYIPKDIKIKYDGRLVKLFAQEQEEVKQNDVLGWLECSANHQEVIELSNELKILREALRNGDLKQVNSFLHREYTTLGELQASYNDFESQYVLFVSSLKNNYYEQKRNSIYSELLKLSEKEENINQQLAVIQRSNSIAKRNFDAWKQLSEEGVVAPLQLEEEENRYIENTLSLQQHQAILIDNNMAQEIKKQDILDLEQTLRIQNSAFYQSLNALEGELEAWKMKYLLIAPESGRIHFSSLITENQLMKQGQLIMSIAPVEYTGFIGEILLPQNSLGKVKTGQKVYIRLDSYPYQEFGRMTGKVDFIANLPNEEGLFFIKVIFDDGYKTSYNKQLIIKNGMTAHTEIITEDALLIEQLFRHLRGLIN